MFGRVRCNRKSKTIDGCISEKHVDRPLDFASAKRTFLRRITALLAEGNVGTGHECHVGRPGPAPLAHLPPPQPPVLLLQGCQPLRGQRSRCSCCRSRGLRVAAREVTGVQGHGLWNGEKNCFIIIN